MLSDDFLSLVRIRVRVNTQFKLEIKAQREVSQEYHGKYDMKSAYVSHR